MRTEGGLTGSMLKWLALLSMTVDHLGASLLEAFVLNFHGNSPLGNCPSELWAAVRAVDRVLRYIGRPAFPIFCFLLVEGLLHTRDVRRYALRLGLFALVSELPFDLALYIDVWEPSHQNVFFTLFLGLVTIAFAREHGDRLLPSLAAFLAGAAAAELLNTDYGAFGVALIWVLYTLRAERIRQCVGGALCCLWEYTAPIAFLLVWFYNGVRGRQPRWFFYVFYPAHLLIYYLVGILLLPGICL